MHILENFVLLILFHLHANVYLLLTTHLHPPKDNLIGNHQSVDRDLLQQRHTHTTSLILPHAISNRPNPGKRPLGKNIVINGWPNGIPQELPNTIFMTKLTTITKPLR